jgi:hypothetical protein
MSEWHFNDDRLDLMMWTLVQEKTFTSTPPFNRDEQTFIKSETFDFKLKERKRDTRKKIHLNNFLI